jgi:hypothetical protein
VPFWDSPVKDADSAAIITMLCHIGTVKVSAHGRPLAGSIVIKCTILYGNMYLRSLFSFVACLMP